MSKTINLNELNGQWVINDQTGNNRVWTRGIYSIVHTNDVFGTGSQGWIVRQTKGSDIFGIRTNGDPWSYGGVFVWNPNATGYDPLNATNFKIDLSGNTYQVTGAGVVGYNGLYDIYETIPTFNEKQVYTNGTNYLFYSSTAQKWVLGNEVSDDSYVYSCDTITGTWASNNETTAPSVVQFFPYMNVTSGNIRSGVYVENLVGTFTDDANAVASDILSSKTAYVQGNKITGTLTINASDVKAGAVVGGVTGVFTSDATVTSSKILNGYTAYANGAQVTGTLVISASDVKHGAVVGETSGTFTSDANATANDMLSGKTAYVKGSKVTGNISASIPYKQGNVVNVPKGYVSSAQDITVGTSLNATTYIPLTSDQTIQSDTYIAGTQTIKGDSNFVASNIKDGVTLFNNVTGTFTHDANAVASDILSGKKAYVSGSKVTGALTITASDVKAGAVVGGVTGTFTNDANAVASDILSGKTAYVSGSKVTGALTVNASDVKYGATVAGVDGTFTYGATVTSSKILNGYTAYANGEQITGNLTINASDVKAGAVVGETTGTFTNDADATANDILSGKTAYVNGSLVTGSYVPSSGGGGGSGSLSELDLFDWMTILSK